jgi:hypothetical protein
MEAAKGVRGSSESIERGQAFIIDILGFPSLGTGGSLFLDFFMCGREEEEGRNVKLET